MSHVLSAVAWPYANGPRHIGHVAGFGVPSDVFSRYMRMAGHEVLMVSGTDEHGTPILVAADGEGVSAKDLADKNNAVIVQDLVDLGLSYDLFTRTTTGNHYNVVQELFAHVHENGYLVEQTTFGARSPSTGRTLPDRYIEVTCPICGYPDARGDQDRRPVLVGARHHQHVVTGHPHVPAEDVGGDTETGDVTDVARAVGVRPRDRGQDAITHNRQP